MSLSATVVLEVSARQLFPNWSLDQVLGALLLERAQPGFDIEQVFANQLAR